LSMVWRRKREYGIDNTDEERGEIGREIDE
jgi:hypothetical protein